MLLQGSSRTNRTDLLINEYTKLLEKGIDASTILVLLQNSYKKDYFVNQVKKTLKINHYEDPQIYTFYGLCYNTIQNYWSYAENSIDFGTTKIQPNLIGLEISQFFLKRAIKEIGFSDYNSKINLIHQLFRRNSLIVNNCLTDKDVEKRSKILKESFGNDAQNALDLFKKYSLEYRAFDYLRQVNLFNYLNKTQNCFQNIKYLILDDADEITPVEFEFIKNLYPQLNECFIGYDKFGSSRLGFLNTDSETINKLEKFFSKEEIINLDNITKLPDIAIEKESYTRSLQMVEQALNKAVDLVNSGVSPAQISIISPKITQTLRYNLEEIFFSKNINYQIITGSQKLSENNIIKNIISLLKYSIFQNIEIDELKQILSGICNIPIKYCLKIIEYYKETKTINYFDLNNDNYNNKLETLIETIKKLENKEQILSQKFYIIYDNLIISNKLNKMDLDKINFFIKQVKDFEEVFIGLQSNDKFQIEVLSQLENSIISENPASSLEIEDNSIIVATAQKIIDMDYKTKYQIWLDTTASDWIKDDFGTIYNAWVFQNSWDKNEFTYEDNLSLSNLKTQKILRKLSLLAENKIFMFSSLYDENGIENLGNFDSFIETQNNISKEEIAFKFVPRPDQKPILEYKQGYLGISAVPGAGKTTILLALIIKLLQNKIKSENIFVLTYMDSAAKNFKERIKQACPLLEKLPNISTIHGLALRILTENSNHNLVGLEEDFEICDDIKRQKIIREILFKQQIEQEEYDKYQVAISYLKLSNLNQKPYTKDKEIYKFLKFYNTYNQTLKSYNLIDYDDMLVKAVELLENNKEIAQYYQNLCHYVIEDEAQDSSFVQQRLLTILSDKHKNLIRCGDINQSITTTFTNADLEGFKSFIKNNKNVNMNHSQRCAKDIYSLANRLISYSKNNDEYKNAFFDIEMQEVIGKNPETKDSIYNCVFETQNEERSFLLSKIREILSTDKNATIAVLVRNNHNIEDYANFFASHGYTVETRNDLLNRQPVFVLIQSILEFCFYPWRNNLVSKIAKILNEQELLKFNTNDFEYIENLQTPFILENSDNLPTKRLSDLIWDLEYWLQNSTKNIDDLSVKIGMHYYNSEIEKSNVYIVSQLMKKLNFQYSNKESFFEKLNEISTKSLNTGSKFFESEKNTCGGIKIMTYHKSKGDEFDYVFIPELTEKNLSLLSENIKIKIKERFLEAIKSLNNNYKKKTENELKIFQIEENLRLLYVAITRAKKYLYITASKQERNFSKMSKAMPSILFDEFFATTGDKNE